MEFRGGALTIHTNEDGTSQLRDSLSRFWCACGGPAVGYVPENQPIYSYRCKNCLEHDSKEN